MSKKRLNTEEIASELSGSSAFFTRQPQQPPAPPAEEEVVAVAETDQAAQPASKETLQQESSMTRNIAILQLLTDEDIAALREPAYQAQTFRLTQQEIEWVKDAAYQLSKDMRRRKVAQADILRISLKLFERLLATQKAELLAVLERIK